VVSSVVNVGTKSSAAATMAEGKEVNRMLIVGVALGGSMLVAAAAILAVVVLVYKQNALVDREQTEEARVEMSDLEPVGGR